MVDVQEIAHPGKIEHGIQEELNMVNSANCMEVVQITIGMHMVLYIVCTSESNG